MEEEKQENPETKKAEPTSQGFFCGAEEDEVGVTEFMGDGESLNGTLKHLFSDFIVNEVTTSGEVLRLSKETVEAEHKRLQEEARTKKETLEATQETAGTFSEKTIESLSKFFSKEDIFKIETFLKEQRDSTGTKSSFELELECPEDKDQRKEVHQLVRDHLVGFDSTTVNGGSDDPEGKKIKVYFVGLRKAGRKFQDKSKRFLHFTMQKSNMETSQAIGLLASTFRKRQNDFSVAGTKDKRGITTQRVSGPGLDPLVMANGAKNW